MEILAALRFGSSKRLPVFLQTEAAECGLASLGMIASYHGHRIDLAGLRRRFTVSLKGATLAYLMQVAGRLHFVLPTAIGATAIVDDVTDKEMKEALKRVGFRR